jgi:hypothetical protein
VRHFRAGLLTRPDLVDLTTETIFEIKPLNSMNAGRLQQLGYLFILHSYDPTGKWWYGNPQIYTPPSGFTVLAGSILVEANPPDAYGDPLWPHSQALGRRNKTLWYWNDSQ